MLAVALTFMLILSTNFHLECSTQEHKIKWIRPTNPGPDDSWISPVALAGDTLFFYQGSYVYVWDWKLDSTLYWYRISNLMKYIEIKFLKETNTILLVYLSNDTSLIVEAHRIDKGKISEFSMKFTKDEYPIMGSFEHTGQNFYFISNNFNFKVLNVATFDTLFNFSLAYPDNDDLVYSLTMSKDGNYCGLLGGKNLYIFNLQNLSIEKRLELRSFPYYKLKFSNDNRYILRYGGDEKLKIIDISNDTSYSINFPGKVENIEFISDNKTILVVEFFPSPKPYQSKAYLSLYDFPEIDTSKKFVIGELGLNFWIGIVENQQEEKILAFPPELYFNRSLYLFDPKKFGPQQRIFTPITYTNLIGERYLGGGNPLTSRVFLFDLKDGKFIQDSKIFTDSIPFKFSSSLPVYYYFRNDTIFIRDIFSNQIINYYSLGNKTFTNFEISDDLNFLFADIPSKNDSCFKILSLPEFEQVFSFSKKEKCLEPIPFFTINHLLNKSIILSKDNKYVAFIYNERELMSPDIFSVYNLEKKTIIYSEMVSEPFSFEFGDYNSDELFICNNGIQIKRVNLETGEEFVFPDVSPFAHSKENNIILNRPDSKYLIQCFSGNSKICIFDKTLGKIQKIIDLGEISYVLGEKNSEPILRGALLYFQPKFSLLICLFLYSPVIAIEDSTLIVLGFNEESKFSSCRFKVLQNPVNNELEIIVLDADQKANQIELVDIMGTVLKTIDINYNKNYYKINVSSLNDGIYFVKIGDKVEKFIKFNQN